MQQTCWQPLLLSPHPSLAAHWSPTQTWAEAAAADQQRHRHRCWLDGRHATATRPPALRLRPMPGRKMPSMRGKPTQGRLHAAQPVPVLKCEYDSTCKTPTMPALWHEHKEDQEYCRCVERPSIQALQHTCRCSAAAKGPDPGLLLPSPDDLARPPPVLRRSMAGATTWCSPRRYNRPCGRCRRDVMSALRVAEVRL